MDGRLSSLIDRLRRLATAPVGRLRSQRGQTDPWPADQDFLINSPRRIRRDRNGSRRRLGLESLHARESARKNLAKEESGETRQENLAIGRFAVPRYGVVPANDIGASGYPSERRWMCWRFESKRIAKTGHLTQLLCIPAHEVVQGLGERCRRSGDWGGSSPSHPATWTVSCGSSPGYRY